MKRLGPWSVVVVGALLAGPIVRADVKTTEKTTFTLEGILGAGMRMFGGSAARDGITSSVALKGNRKASLNDLTGEIVDLDEQNLYGLDMKKKTYRVRTFAELRADYEKARADAQKQQAQAAKQAKPDEKAAPATDNTKPLEYTVDVKDTGQKKSIAGYDTREVVVTVVGHQAGQTLEDGGGVVMTDDMWIGPKIGALDELYAFELKYVKAVYGEDFAADMQQMASVVAFYPMFQTMSTRMASESNKLQGTTISSTTTFESVRSADEMKQMNNQPPPTSSGGFGSALAKKMMGTPAQPQQRTKVMTSQHDILSVGTAVSAADVALPADFKLTK